MNSNITSINMIEKIQDLPHKFLKDMVYLILSDNLTYPLEDDLYFKHNPSAMQLLEKARDQDKGAKQGYFEFKRLGKYAESIIGYYFKQFSPYKLVAQNVQLNENGITKGEIDFILEDISKPRIYQIELAVKFYLKTKVNGKVIYLGPSTKDWFARKIDRLKNHQLKIIEREKKLMPQALMNMEICPKMMIKGCIFLPFNDWQSSFFSFTKGWWVYYSDDLSPLGENNRFRLITSKEHWIFPYYIGKSIDYLTFVREIRAHFSKSNQELMVIRLNSKGKIIDRGFLVRQKWPN